MTTRFVTESNLYLTVKNTTNPSRAIVVVNRLIKPGESKAVPMRYVVGDYFRSRDLQALVHKNQIQVIFNNQPYEFNDVGPLSENYLGSLASPSAMPLGQLMVYAALADLPGPADVPEGFCAWVTAINMPAYSNGVDHWYDAAGAILV